jgi:hypothetical protein
LHEGVNPYALARNAGILDYLENVVVDGTQLDTRLLEIIAIEA